MTEALAQGHTALSDWVGRPPWRVPAGRLQYHRRRSNRRRSHPGRRAAAHPGHRRRIDPAVQRASVRAPRAVGRVSRQRRSPGGLVRPPTVQHVQRHCHRTCRPRRARRATKRPMAAAGSSSTPTPRPSSSSWTSALGQRICASAAGRDRRTTAGALRPGLQLPKGGLEHRGVRGRRGHQPSRLPLRGRRRRLGQRVRAAVGPLAGARLYRRLARTANTLKRDLAPAQARWAELVGRRRLPWYAEEQARRGAFAALVGLRLE